ncbi:MAG: MerR family transcriptional regulator [Alphaproteobacteria bacterium GM7ARS4]|nr:MerR family transcriptional regulator [Alphaproteobacteria bacterium GM7ARS4]
MIKEPSQKTQEQLLPIGDVAQSLNLPPHVLRYWETQFIHLRPLKKSDKRRYYRQEDVALLKVIKRFLHTEGYTIKGACRLLNGKTPPDLDALSQQPFPLSSPRALLRQSLQDALKELEHARTWLETPP